MEKDKFCPQCQEIARQLYAADVSTRTTFTSILKEVDKKTCPDKEHLVCLPLLTLIYVRSLAGKEKQGRQKTDH